MEHDLKRLEASLVKLLNKTLHEKAPETFIDYGYRDDGDNSIYIALSETLVVRVQIVASALKVKLDE